MSIGYAGTNHPSVRQNNRAAIFRTLYDAAPITRVDIAARTGLSSKTVSIIMDELMDHGLVRELGHRESAGMGRKAIELEVDPESRFAIGIDVAAPTVTATLVDLAGHAHEQIETQLNMPWRVINTIPTATNATELLLAKLSSKMRAKIVGVGIGAPGRFKVENGRSLGTHFLEASEWMDLGASELEHHLQLPVAVDNNANTSALAELWFGSSKGVSDFVLLNLSAALGMGIVVGGDVYRGGNQRAGEAAHITVNVDGPRCSCGNTGCLAKYLSRDVVLGGVRARLAAGEPSTLHDTPDLSLDDVIAAYRADDPLAVAISAGVIRYLAAALVSIINTYDPTMILLGRLFVSAGEKFFDQLRAEVRDRTSPAISHDVRIEAADVSDAPVIGAATLALRDFFRSPLLPPTPANAIR